jgi:hypothetical protein
VMRVPATRIVPDSSAARGSVSLFKSSVMVQS